MEVMASFSGYVKTEAEAVDSYHGHANSDALGAEDAQQLALEQATQDMDLACESLKISPDPMVWSHHDVRRWLLWTIEHYNLPENSVDVSLFAINGATLCAWGEQDFTIRSHDCGEIINTLLDVWKSTGKLRRTNIFMPNSTAAAPTTLQQQHQQQSQFVKFENIHHDSSSYPMQSQHQQFQQQQQQQFNYAMSYDMPSPPPSYNSLMLNRQHHQQQQQAQRPSNNMQLFFNAGEPMQPLRNSNNNNPMTPPSSAGSMTTTMNMQFAPPQNNNMPLYGGGGLKQQQMYGRSAMPSGSSSSASFIMGSMPTPSPCNSTGNYGSDDCESLESYDMTAAAVAEKFAAAAAAGAGVSCGGAGSNVVAQCLINTAAAPPNSTGSNVVSSTANAAAPTQAAFYDKYYGNPPGQANIHLWQFLKELLAKPELHGTCIRWVDRTKGVFKIEDSVRVARLWGKRKNRPAMNYDKLSRSIRQYYKKGIMKKTEKSQRLVYQFCHPYSC